MEKASAFGNYRAVVIDNKDKEQFGRVLIWIPDLMPEVDRTKGIWARPANNPIGGRNKEDDKSNYYAGSSYIPHKGSWIFVFFEGGNINRPYYFGALDLENTKVLPENQVGSNFEDKWTVLKSGEGRTIVVSDDPDDARTEITGKKRQMTNPPSGDTASVYTIDGNQTTILFDERAGKEKILIRTYKGDFFHVDIDEQKLQVFFENDIIIKTNGSFDLTAAEEINIKSTTDSIYMQSDIGDINIKAGENINIESDGDTNILSNGDLFQTASTNVNIQAGSVIATDGASRQDQNGASQPADEAAIAKEATPEGERDD